MQEELINIVANAVKFANIEHDQKELRFKMTGIDFRHFAVEILKKLATAGYRIDKKNTNA